MMNTLKRNFILSDIKIYRKKIIELDNSINKINIKITKYYNKIGRLRHLL